MTYFKIANIPFGRLFAYEMQDILEHNENHRFVQCMRKRRHSEANDVLRAMDRVKIPEYYWKKLLYGCVVILPDGKKRVIRSHNDIYDVLDECRHRGQCHITGYTENGRFISTEELYGGVMIDPCAGEGHDEGDSIEDDGVPDEPSVDEDFEPGEEVASRRSPVRRSPPKQSRPTVGRTKRTTRSQVTKSPTEALSQHYDEDQEFSSSRRPASPPRISQRSNGRSMAAGMGSPSRASRPQTPPRPSRPVSPPRQPERSGWRSWLNW